MCANCGCQSDKTAMVDMQTGETTMIAAAHDHESGLHSHDGVHYHSHGADHDHHGHTDDHGHVDSSGHSGHAKPHVKLSVVDIETRILKKNDEAAAKNRAWFAGREILALNLVSSPGAGKTALLERTIREFGNQLPLYVIEGDQATANDGKRISAAGGSVVQINTGTGCHLDAVMVTQALSALKPAPRAVVLIENVGNLVCPALFDLGEWAKVVIFSITDGEDKPLKYPHMFSAAKTVILNKIDLLPYLNFSLEQAITNVRKINAGARILQASVQSGEGIHLCLKLHGRRCERECGPDRILRFRYFTLDLLGGDPRWQEPHGLPFARAGVA